MKKTWDSPAAEFLFPKGLVFTFLVALGLCLVLIVPYRIHGAAKLNEANKDIQAAVAEKRTSDAISLLKSYIKKYGGDESTDKIWNDILNVSARGCWKGYGEWKTELQDSSGERFLYFYYPGEGDPLYVAGEQEAYYLLFSDAELSSVDEVLEAIQAKPESRYLASRTRLEYEKRLMYGSNYANEGKLEVYEVYPGLTSTHKSFEITYDLDNDTASVSCWIYDLNKLDDSGDISSQISLERME